MTETPPPDTPRPSVYRNVALALAALLLAALLAGPLVRADFLSAAAGAGLVLAVLLCQNVLAWLYFLHLRWDGSKVWFLLLPTFLLGAVLVVALLPDLVFTWYEE